MSQWFNPEEVWTITNVIHTVSTFFFFHWIKGSPEDAQGDYSSLTLYEQIDAGVPYTATKKFLMAIPAFLCYMSCSTAKYERTAIVVNVSMLCLALIPKFPEMHKVRLFGMNSSTGIDDPVEIKASSRPTSSRSPRSSARLAAQMTKRR